MQIPITGVRLPDSLSHGCAVPDLRRSACLPPAPRATSSTPSKRELFGQVIFHLSDKSRRTCRGAHCAPGFCAEFAFGSLSESLKKGKPRGTASLYCIWKIAKNHPRERKVGASQTPAGRTKISDWPSCRLPACRIHPDAWQNRAGRRRQSCTCAPAHKAAPRWDERPAR